MPTKYNFSSGNHLYITTCLDDKNSIENRLHEQIHTDTNIKRNFKKLLKPWNSKIIFSWLKINLNINMCFFSYCAISMSFWSIITQGHVLYACSWYVRVTVRYNNLGCNHKHCQISLAQRTYTCISWSDTFCFGSESFSIPSVLGSMKHDNVEHTISSEETKKKRWEEGATMNLITLAGINNGTVLIREHNKSRRITTKSGSLHRALSWKSPPRTPHPLRNSGHALCLGLHLPFSS